MNANSSSSDVIVIGAGVIGASVTWALAKRGYKVHLLDQGQSGHGCSYANAGWVTPCFAMPLPMPGMFFKSLKWLLNPNSPLHIKPSLSWELMSWLLTFMKNMNEAQASRAIHGLVQLSIETQSLYAELGKTHPEIHYRTPGLLMVSRTKDGVAAARDELERMQKVGISGRHLDGKGIQELEKGLIGNFLGGVFFDRESSVEPYALVQALVSECKKMGASISENCHVTDFNLKEGSVHSVETSQGSFHAKEFVLCTGSWSSRFSDKLKLKIPVLGGKGYSLSLPPLPIQPSHPVMFVEEKIAITPRENGIRVAGTLELVNQDFSINQRRLNNVVKAAKTVLNWPDSIQPQEVWRGLRPCTPDGVPLIGRHKQIKNLCLALGHQMLGLQSGAGTGELVARIMMGEKTDGDLNLFDPNRF